MPGLPSKRAAVHGFWLSASVMFEAQGRKCERWNIDAEVISNVCPISSLVLTNYSGFHKRTWMKGDLGCRKERT